MASSQARDLSGPTKTGDSITSPTRKTQMRPTTSRQQPPLSTGFPPNIEGPQLNFTQVLDEATPRGNRRYDFMMREMGYYGHFIPMDKKAYAPHSITLDCTAIRDGIDLVLQAALRRALYKRGDIAHADIDALAKSTATTLTTGCMLALYCRLRTVNKGNLSSYETFIQRPHTVAGFEIPTPYALAFQYLGLFRVENAVREVELIPTVTATDARSNCCGTAIWSPTAYQTAVEFAKSLGISFKEVDQTVKLGSAWWLLKSVSDTPEYYLQACLPETNYTPEDAVLRALWCVTPAGSFHVDIADLSDLDLERGTFLRSPPPDIALTCFHGLMESPEDLYDVV